MALASRRLRDLVEAEPDRLPQIRAELEAVEAELWDEADAAFATGEPARLDRLRRNGVLRRRPRPPSTRHRAAHYGRLDHGWSHERSVTVHP